MKKILYVEDEKPLSEAVSYFLTKNGYWVDCAYNGKEALEKCLQTRYDMIVMDIMMPVMDGITALKQIRLFDHQIPIIMLSAKTTSNDIVTGLDEGANDYITKPYKAIELLARIRNLIRKEHCINFDGMEVNIEKKTVSKGTISYNLSREELDLLYALINNPTSKYPSHMFYTKGDEGKDTYLVSVLNMKIKSMKSRYIIRLRNGLVFMEERVNKC